MRRCSIDNHDNKFVLVRLADLAQKEGHVLSVHLLGRHKIEATIPRADRGVLVTELSDQGQAYHRTMRGKGPSRIEGRSFCQSGPHLET